MSLALVGALAGCTRAPSQGGGDGGGETAAYRYYRWNITAWNGDATYSGLGEIRLNRQVNGENVALGAAVTVPSEFSSTYEASNLVDGNVGTYWLQSSVEESTIMLDLGSAEAIETYEFSSSNIASRNPTAWTMEGSNDGDAWDLLDTQGGITWPSTSTIHEFTIHEHEAAPAGATYPYWRLLVTDIDGSNYLGVSMLQLRGAEGGADLTQSAGGTISASSEWGTGPAAAAFDGSTGTGWLSSDTSSQEPLPQWLMYEFPEATALAEYVVGNGPGSATWEDRSPRAWKLQGSPDGAKWYTADEQSAVVWTAHSETQTFAISAE